MEQGKKKGTKWIKMLLYLLGVLVFQEAVIRFCFPLPELENFDRINYLVLDIEGGGSEHSRNQTRQWQSQPDTDVVFNHYMNGYGFRDNEWLVARQGSKNRVLFIGDSFVEGVMAEQDHTIPESFKRMANASQYEVFNGGMLGVGLDEYLQLAADILPLYKPDVAFLVIYANDLGQEAPVVPPFFLSPEYFSVYTPRLLELITQMNKNGAVPFRWNSIAKPYLVAETDPTSDWQKKLEVAKPHVTPQLFELMKSGEFNLYRTNALAKEERHLKLPPALGETIPFFNYTCSNAGVKPVVIYIPSRNQVTNYYHQFEREYCQVDCPDSIDLTTSEYQLHQQVLASQCKQFNVQFIDLTAVVKAEEMSGNHLYWNYDEHMRGKGYELLGITIWQQFKGAEPTSK